MVVYTRLDTTTEGPFSNLCHRVWDDNTFQICASIKGIRYNFRHFGNRNNSHSIFYFIFCHKSVDDCLYIARFYVIIQLISVPYLSGAG